jgi:hypothetical protein
MAAAAEARIEGGVAEPVVSRAALRIFERLVGFVQFLEPSLGVGVAVAAIGMALFGQAAKSGLDLRIACAALNTGTSIPPG